MRRSVVWMPVLLLGAMVYWTLALGFGGLSLMSLTSDCPPDPEGSTRDSYQSIRVNLTDSPETPVDGVGSVTVDLLSDHETAGSGVATPPGASEQELGSSGQGASGQGANGQDERGSGRRSRSDRGPGETAF